MSTKDGTNFAISGTANDHEPQGYLPVEIGKFIRYALSELGGFNAHHEFEQLCFHLAKRRIYPNILPATGPVSAGGDQGADFETYEVGSQEGVFFANASEGKVVFACSLEKNVKKKVKGDLETISKAKLNPERVILFSNQAVPVGTRHKLQQYAKEEHGVNLEIVDLFAISELLSDREVFWIATRFLSIPSEIFPASTDKKLDWYQEVLTTTVAPEHLTTDGFIKVKRAIRYATFRESNHADLPHLFEKIRLFRDSKMPWISRRAFYEEFVATLRGLEFVDGYEDGLREYLGNIENLAAVDEVEDAAVLISYAVGAHGRKLLEIPLEEILAWRGSLLKRIETLLEEDISPGRRSELLDTKGQMQVFGFLDEYKKSDIKGAFEKSVEVAIETWKAVLKFADEAPMFPLEKFARRLSLLAPQYGDAPGYAKLCEKADKLLAARSGKQKIGELAFERSKAYSKAGRILDAIDQLHVAHESSLSRETALHTVFIPLFLAKMYSSLGLYAAAKYYALASSFAAVKIGEEDLLPHVYRGLAEAAASDHANGASLSFFMALRAVLFVASEFSTSGESELQAFEWSRLYLYASLLTYGARLVGKSLETYLVDELMPGLGLKEDYDKVQDDLARFYEPYKTYADIAHKAMSEGIAPPFADTASVRKLVWNQLGIIWQVEWDNDYKTTATAEGFVALLQILLCDLRKVELSILRSNVIIRLKIHSGKLRIEDEPSNECVIRDVWLPEGAPEWVMGAAATILKVVSAYDHKKFLEIIEERMKSGLMNKINPHAPYEMLFGEFYSDEYFKKLHELSQNAVDIPSFVIKTAKAFNGLDGVHKDYAVTKSQGAIKNRYQNARKGLKHTLPRRLKDEKVRAAIDELRKDGWKDWHILMAIFNIRANYAVQGRVGSHDPDKMAGEMKLIMNQEEQESDPQPPAYLFTTEELRRAQIMYIPAALKTLGFYCWQQTPVHEAIREFLGRFNFWTDDIPHTDPFVQGS